jgi:prepilin-type N-terminal cleavage/methylation domain-containing protein
MIDNKTQLANLKTSEKGFTLIEMLVVVGVILILVAIVVPNFLNAVWRAKMVQAQTNIISYEAAVAEYMTDTRKKIPSGSQNVYYALSGLAPFNAKASKRYNPLTGISTPAKSVATPPEREILGLGIHW